MFIKLMNNDVVAGRFQYITKTLEGILTGAITSPSQLNSGFFLQGQSKFTVGAYPTPTYWTSLYNLTTSVSSGKIILSKPSAIVGKNNYLQISYDTSYIYMATGTAFAANTLTNIGTLTYALPLGVEFTPIYLRFADSFVHLFSKTFTATASYIALGMEITSNPYDSYSQEAAFKLLQLAWVYNAGGLSTTLHISNMFAPNNQTYTANNSTISPAYNITQANTDAIATTRGENLQDNQLLVVPLIFNQLSTGWLGANISELTGLYLCSNQGLAGGEYVTVNGETFGCLNINKAYITDATLLFRI
jgi:hypothetical protein